MFQENRDNLKKPEAEVAARTAGYTHSPEAMVDSTDKEEVDLFCELLRERQLDTLKPVSRKCLQLLEKEIVLNGVSVRIKCSHASPEGMIKFTAKKKLASLSGRISNFFR